MRRIASFFLAILFSSPAFAGDFTVDQAIQVGTALSQLTCGNRVVKDGAKESVICDPYKWSPGVSWVIARNLNKAQDVMRQFDRMRELEITKVKRREDGGIKDDALAALNVTIRGWLDAPSKADFEKLKPSDLEDKNIAPQILSALLPIVE